MENVQSCTFLSAPWKLNVATARARKIKRNARMLARTIRYPYAPLYNLLELLRNNMQWIVIVWQCTEVLIIFLALLRGRSNRINNATR